MRPTGCQLDVAAGRQPLKAWIAVDLNDAVEPRQMGSRTLGPAIRTVEINRPRWVGSVPGPVVTGIDPEPAGLGTAAAWVEHGYRCVVGEQRLRSEHMLGEPGLQRLQPPDGAAHPVGERRAIQFDTVPGEDLALPVERQV